VKSAWACPGRSTFQPRLTYEENHFTPGAKAATTTVRAKAGESTSPPRQATEKKPRLDGDRLDQKQLLTALAAFKRGDFSVRPAG